MPHLETIVPRLCPGLSQKLAPPLIARPGCPSFKGLRINDPPAKKNATRLITNAGLLEKCLI